VERLDAALLRPGRIDRKIQYKLATQEQAEALFLRFYPESVLELDLKRSDKADGSITEKNPNQDIPTLLRTLASQFSSAIPPHEFSTAEIQGYLLGCKTSPCQAAAGAAEWVGSEIAERQEKELKEEAKKQENASKFGPGVIPGLGMGMGPMTGMGMYPTGHLNNASFSTPSLSTRDPSMAVTPVIPVESATPAVPAVDVPVIDTPIQATEGSVIPIQEPLNGVKQES